MKKILLVFFIASVSLFGQEQKLTLSQSLEIGIKNSKDLIISKAKLISSDAQITAASSQMLPQLSFTANYTRLSSVPPFEVSLPFLPAPVIVSQTILNNYNFRLSLQQPLFTGFRLLSLKSAAKSNHDASKTDYTKDINDVAWKIQNAFWNYYKAQLNVNVLTENLSQIKQHLDDTKNFLENGLATKNDLLKLEVQYSNIKLQKIDADNQLDIARAAFNQAIGLPLEAPTQIEAQEIKVESSDLNYQNLLAEANTNRSELKSLEFRLMASEDQLKAAESGWYPSVFLTGDYMYNRPNQRILPAVDKFKDSWDVGVTLTWSMWNWGYTGSQTTIAEQNKVQTETSLAQLKDAINIEVYQDYLTFKRSYDKVQVSELGVKQAEENYRIIQEKYNTQVASSTDLIDAESSLLQAKTSYDNSLVEYELAKVLLDKSIGKKIY
ncbi:MAG: TolC family protein [Ignavibacteriaceae bacterium]